MDQQRGAVDQRALPVGSPVRERCAQCQPSLTATLIGAIAIAVWMGGWGPALADQGSGHRIGLEALRALYAKLQLRDAASYVQSGNVVFGSTARASATLERTHLRLT